MTPVVDDVPDARPTACWSPDGAACARALAAALLALGELERTSPHEVDLLCDALVRHLRSWRPLALGSLGVDAVPAEVAP